MLAQLFDVVSRFAFSIAAAILMLLAIVMIIYGVGHVAVTLFQAGDMGIAVLRGVGYVVVAIAVFDLAIYLLEEEVLRGREMRAPSEARRSLTKFISTIAIAVFLEGLVTVFRVSHTNVRELVYPALLLLTAMLLVLGLGLFQRLSASVEAQVEPNKKKDG
ncbi:MAG TPA: GNAT family acetyltransferase [Xanthobacteraceae bacterium]|nr:GNAT family acetyltransferase [Xanthobacteraceae bacterium]